MSIAQATLRNRAIDLKSSALVSSRFSWRLRPTKDVSLANNGHGPGRESETLVQTPATVIGFEKFIETINGGY